MAESDKKPQIFSFHVTPEAAKAQRRFQMTERRHEFAAAALTGLLAGKPTYRYSDAAEDAVRHADALIERLLEE
jgi:hypothetical protein